MPTMLHERKGSNLNVKPDQNLNLCTLQVFAQQSRHFLYRDTAEGPPPETFFPRTPNTVPYTLDSNPRKWTPPPQGKVGSVKLGLKGLGGVGGGGDRPRRALALKAFTEFGKTAIHPHSRLQ